MDAKSLQPYLTLFDPVDHSLPGSSVHGILQARLLEWVAMPLSKGSSQRSNLHLMSPALAGGFFTTSVTCKPVVVGVVDPLLLHFGGNI